MTISPDWKPDPREAFELDLCRLRNVYRTVKARRPYYCDQCQGWIVAGEEHDTQAVAGAGIGGYTHPRRLHCSCRKTYIDRQNKSYAEMHNIVLSICMICARYYRYKEARGNPGLSHGICGDECENVWMDEMCEVPEGK